MISTKILKKPQYEEEMGQEFNPTYTKEIVQEDIGATEWGVEDEAINMNKKDLYFKHAIHQLLQLLELIDDNVPFNFRLQMMLPIWSFFSGYQWKK